MLKLDNQNLAMPENWHNLSLDSVITEHIKSPCQVKSAKTEGVYPFFTSGIKILRSNAFLVNGGNIFMATGGQFHVLYYEGKSSYSSDTYSITGKDIDNKFLYYDLLRSKNRINHLMFGGSGLKHLQKKDFRKTIITFPKEEVEQQTISNIFTTLDTVIERTDEIIKKQKKIKQGLMQDLFRYGIDEKRQIRSEETHEFKDSQLGRVPNEWEIVTLDSLLSKNDNSMRSGPFGSALLKSELVSDGIPLLGIDNIFIENFYDGYTRFVSDEKYRKLSRYTVKGRDVAITIMGTVGRSCVIPGDIELALSSKHIWTMSFDLEKYLPELISWQLNYSDHIIKKFRSNGQGGVMDAINSKILRSLSLPLPNISEQKRILDIYLVHNSNIEKKELYYQKLLNLKTGLMEDLLTGRKSVASLMK